MSANGITAPGAEIRYQPAVRLAGKPGAADRAREAEKAAQAAAVPSASAVEGTAGSKDSGKVDAYEPASSKPVYAVDMKQIQQMKAETEERMRQLVQQTLSKQITGGETNKLFELIQNAEYTVEDVEQARKDIAEDGYWGVEQTSDRIVKMATALTGGDPSKLDSMMQAFEKGFKEAEKLMGGSLPEISQKTRTAVLDKFQALKDQYSQAQNPTQSAAVAAAAGVS